MGNVSDKKESVFREKKFAFLTGLANESNPVIMQDVLETVLKLQSEFKSQVYILTGNLKVASDRAALHVDQLPPHRTICA